ncbi:MAG: polysaccharide biosynthesis transport protein [Betaproteobacteria bacterium]
MSTEIAVRKHYPLPAAERQEAEISELVIYWRSIVKRKWAILGIAIVVSVLAAVAALNTTPVYHATATVLIEQNRAKIVSIEEVYSGGGNNREHFETQADLLGSRALAVKVIAKLNLTRHPEFDPRQAEPPFWRAIFNGLGIGDVRTPPTEREIHSAVLNTFMNRTSIEPGRMSQLIRVSFDAADPQLAADIANELVQSYIDLDMENRFDMTKRASEWLKERLTDLKRNLEQSEQALQAYREKEHIVQIQGVGQSGAARQLEDLSRSLADARQKRAEAASAYNLIKSAKGNLETLPVIQRNPLMARLKEFEAESERRYAENLKRYGPQHPRMIEAEGDLRQARENTRRQIETVIGSLANEYEAARANERAVERSIAETKGDVQGINRKEFQLNALERQVATNRQLYDTFLSRFKETSTTGDVPTSPVARITDPAVMPDIPLKPKKSQIVAIAFVLALFLGIVAAIFLERLDNTLRSPEDIENKLGQPMLAILPLLTGDSGQYVERHFLDHPKSLFSEGVRTARTAVLLSSMNTLRKSLLVTSAVSDEGKTAVAMNLALAHAQTQRVLLIDADLRSPSVAEALGLNPAAPGLVDLVTGGATFGECLQRVNGSSLYIMTAGSSVSDPLDLILSARFRHVMAALSEACDILVMDSPPIHPVSDAAALSKFATGVVFVVKADATPKHLARRSIQALQSVNAKLLGVVLNQLDFSKVRPYYGSYEGASYGYYPRLQKSLAQAKTVASLTATTEST